MWLDTGYMSKRQSGWAFSSGHRANFAIIFAVAVLSIVGTGCNLLDHTRPATEPEVQGTSSFQQRRPTELTLDTVHQLAPDALQSFQPDGNNDADTAIPASGDQSSSATASGWQYCLASSYADQKVYISPLFSKSATLSQTEGAFDRMLLQSQIQHDDVQCPNAKIEDSLSSMRQYAIRFNQQVGNTIVTLDWDPLRPIQPESKSTANAAFKSSSGGRNANMSGWQYCLTSSQAEHKLYVSPLFPKSTALSNTEAAFDQMLLQSAAQHEDVQCPNGDLHSLASMRQYAISSNYHAGNTIVILNWKSTSPPGVNGVANNTIRPSQGGSTAAIDGWQFCVAPSYAENKVYVSQLFPKNGTLIKTETAFGEMLSQSNVRHDNVQCPKNKDEQMIARMRQHAIAFNSKAGKAIIALDWKQ